MTRRIAVFGLFGSGNLGNDASLTAMVAFLRSRYPDAEITVVCQEPERVTAATGLRGMTITARGNRPLGARGLLRTVAAMAQRLRDIPYAARRVRTFDAIVVPGMGVLEERLGARPWGMPWMLAVWAWAAAALRVPFALVSVGADAAENPWTRRLFGTATRRAAYRSFRDGYSRDTGLSMAGMAGPSPTFPDLAFAMEVPAAVEASSHGAGEPIAVGVLNWYGADDDPVSGSQVHERYVRSMAELVTRFAEDGHPVSLVVGDAVDAAAMRAIRARVVLGRLDLAGRVLEEPAATTFDELLAQLAPSGIVVASRYHNLVAGLMLGKPIVSLGYGPKNDELLTRFGLDAYGQQLDSFDAEQARRQVCDALARREEIGKLVMAQLGPVKDELGHQFSEVAALLDRR